MRKTLIYSALILMMALAVTWSAVAAAPQSSPAAAPQASQAPPLSLDPAQGAVATASCTISCPNDPISCTSTAGDCHYAGGKGFIWIVCDGHKTFCPGGE
jgi:hypothetical protein